MKLITAQPARHPAPTTRATALAYLLFERPDLDRAERFLVDFGLRVVQRDADDLYLRGTDAAPYCYHVRRATRARFVGFGLEVADEAALQALSKLPAASAIEAANGPGGGLRVQLRDPAGLRVDAIAGRAAAAPLPHRAPLAWNSVAQTVRVNGTQRPPVSPPEVVRLGHVVLELADFQAGCAWYTRTFGFIPSDVQLLPDGSPAVAFMRLDLGETPADHHTLALAQGIDTGYSHSAYELVDADAVGIGQRLLRERGWTHAWGIGRHILGSQLFDYWQDPWGDKHEHYCDGDLFTADMPTGLHPVSREAMAQWGPPMPASFTRPPLSPTLLIHLLRNLRRSPDLTASKLWTLMRLFA